MRSSTMNNKGTELIYEATLRRAMLYGIHIQGTVIDNHDVLGEDLAGVEPDR